MRDTIVVINPNSNQAVTDGLDRALAPFRLQGGPKIDCVTLAEGPFGIESQRDADSVVMPMAKMIEGRDDAAAVVIACYSDPGIDTCRFASPVPVFGIQESGVLTALARADLIGIVAIAEASIHRHRLYMRRMGVLDRVAGERALNMSVDESARGAGTFDRLVEIGTQLKSDGAGALILGCAGMATHRAGLEQRLQLPVIDPTQAAVSQAMGMILAERLAAG